MSIKRSDLTTSKWKLRFDSTAVLLVLSNIFTIVVALLEHWRLSDVIWIYWGQSVVIGFFNWRRIRCLKRFSTEGCSSNGVPMQPTRATQREVANFFAIHYGFFHLVYLGFLWSERSDLSHRGAIAVVVCVVVFAMNHWFSFRHYREQDSRRTPNIGAIMAFPYARIIPMHLTILFGDWFAKDSVITLVFFLALKTVADLIMHLVEHGMQEEPPKNGEAIADL
jgi:hypothetical protein